MKKIILALCLASGVITTGVSTPASTIQSTGVERGTGTILSLDSDGGKIANNNNGEILDFKHPGAEVVFAVGDNVTYLKIRLPNGNTIVNEIKKPL